MKPGRPIIFETARLVVYPYTQDDHENFFLVNGDEEIMRYIRPAKTRKESDIFLEEVISYSRQNPLYGRWAVYEKQGHDFIGSFALIPVEKTTYMQLGYSLLKASWGKGYATELTHAGLHYVFTKTDLEAVYGITEKDNIASQKVLLKAGFVYANSFEEDGKELLQFRYERVRFEPRGLQVTKGH